MSELPILVVHGAFVWKAALVVFTVGVPLLLWNRSARRVRRNASDERARLEPAVDSVDRFVADQPMAIVGRLTAKKVLPENIAAVSHRYHGTEISMIQGAGLAIELDEHTVGIDGPVTVVAGSDHRTYFSLRTRLRYEVHGIHSGDRVVARGRLHASADGSAGSDYRVAKTRWTLATDDGPVELATRETVRVAPPSIGRHVFRAVLGAMIFLFVFGLGGTLAQFSDYHALAAATPFHRARALERLSVGTLPMTEAKLARQLAVLALREDCGGTVEALFMARRYQRAIEVSRACAQPHNPEVAAAAAAWLVDYGLSSELYARAGTVGREAAIAHVLAGRWDRAEHTFTRWADEVDVFDDDVDVEAARHKHVAGLRCLAKGAAARAQRPQALAQLRALAETGGERCVLMLADMLPRAQRLQYLVDHPRPENSRGVGRVRQGLAERGHFAWTTSILPRFSAGRGSGRFDLVALPIYERIVARASHLGEHDRSRDLAAISLRAADYAGAALDTNRALALAQAYGAASDKTVRAQAHAIVAAAAFRQTDYVAARAAAIEAGYYGELTRALIALNQNRDVTLLREQTTMFREWIPSIERALAGDTSRLERHLHGDWLDAHGFSHALAVLGQLLPPAKHERYADMLAHRGDSLHRTGVGFMFMRDSIDELAARNLDAPELAALYRGRLTRRYQLVRNPSLGAFLALIPE